MILLLQVDKLGEARRSWQEYAYGQNRVGLLLAALLGAAVLGLVLYAVLSGRERMAGRRTFLRLARIHGLTDAETRFLMQVALRAAAQDPTSIYVRRSLFESAAGALPSQEALAASVRRKVFGP